MSHVVPKFAQCGWDEAKLARLEQLMEALRPVNLDPHPLSIAIAAIIFNVYSR